MSQYSQGCFAALIVLPFRAFESAEQKPCICCMPILLVTHDLVALVEVHTHLCQVCAFVNPAVSDWIFVNLFTEKGSYCSFPGASHIFLCFPRAF